MSIHSVACLAPWPPQFFVVVVAVVVVAVVVVVAFSIIREHGRVMKNGLSCIVLNANQTNKQKKKNGGGLGTCSLIPRPFMSPRNSLGGRLMTMHLKLLYV